MSAVLGRMLLSFALCAALSACGSDNGPADPAPAQAPAPAPVVKAPDPVASPVVLTGVQEVPAVATAANGKGTLTLDRSTGALTGSVTLDGIQATMAHIHDGAAGSNGAVIVPLAETAPGVWSVPDKTVLTAAQMTSFEGGTLYVNAHSTANPGGEIRAQIGREVYYAEINGKQQVPGNESAATGTGIAVLDPATRTLTGGITLAGISPTAAHIHTGAAGTNGGVSVNLAQSATAADRWEIPAGTVLTEAQLASLRAGGLYFNAHTTANPGGEVRGQIGRLVRTATLNGGHEVPATTSTGSGTGLLVVDPATRAASGGITFSGVTPTMAHIHLAPLGVNGPVIVPLAAGDTASSYKVPDNTVLTADQMDAFLKNNLYYNVHSAAFPGGELRGQIDNDAHHAH